MTKTRWPPTPCHLHRSENFDKIDSFLKPVLNICILGNLIVGSDEWVIKEGAGCKIHQSKGWYSLRPSRTSKVDFFAELIFGCKPLTFFL